MRRIPMSVTHDYTKLGWGHNITFISIQPDGMRAAVIGFGNGVQAGDFLVLSDGRGGTTRYLVTRWKQRRPSDCWSAEIEFAPRAAGAAA
jgi:hypothetical protein